MELVTIRDGPRLVPATQFDLDELEKVRPRQLLRTEITFSRSLPHHRWYWGLLNVVAEGLGTYAEPLHIALKAKADLIEAIVPVRGVGLVVQTGSTSFKAMDEIRFTEYRRLAVEILFRDYLPGVRRRDVWDRVEELTGEPCPWPE